VRTRTIPALVLVSLACTVGTAAADGDPASDVLYTENSYLPYDAPPPAAATALKKTIESVYARHYRIKVAVIGSQVDLGAVPSLWGKPTQYAKFLGTELETFYVGPLLIVMPSGWGVYDGGRSVAAESGVLNGINVNGSSVDNLVRSAATAVQRLESADALKSADIRPPYVYPQSTTIHPGKKTAFSFRVLDDSNRAAVAVTIVAGEKTIASLSSPLAPTNYPNARSVSWPVQKRIATKGVKICMTATDAAGNKSGATCMPLKVAKR